MANFNSIKHEIDQNVNTNGQQAITGAILNETLKDMLDEVDLQKQDTLVAGQNITISGNVISASGGSGQTISASAPLSIYNDTMSLNYGTGLKVGPGNALEADFDYVQEKLTAGNGINIDGNNVISTDLNDIAGNGLQVWQVDGRDVLEVNTSSIATKTDLQSKQDALTAGDGIEIDQNDEISIKAGTGLGFDANGYLINTGGGGGGTTYTAGDGIEIDQNDAINAKLGNGLQLDASNNIEIDPSVVATQSDLSGYATTSDLQGYLPLEGGQLQNSSVGTELVVKSPDDDTWVSIGASDSGIPRVWLEDTITNPSNGDIKELKISTDRIDITAYNQNTSSWRGDTLYFPELKSGTIALTSDIPAYAQYTGGTGIDITSGTISVDASDLDGNGLSVDANGALEVDTTVIQEKLTAGTGISISAQNVISATGVGTSLWTSGTGTDSLIGPDGGTSSGAGSISLNGGATASNSTSMAGGYRSSAIGWNSLAYGNQAAASTDATISLGDHTSSNIASGVALGHYTQTGNKQTGSVALGKYNYVDTGSTATQNTTFSIGNGTGNNSRSNALELTAGNKFYMTGVGSYTGSNSSSAVSVQDVINGKQDQLTAGSGISISGNVISATGGGGSGLWLSGSGTNSLIAPSGFDPYIGGIPTDTDASGQGAISMGWNTVASGDYSVVMGVGGRATQEGAVSLGGSATHKFALAGAGGRARGYNSVSIGANTDAKNDYETALGADNYVYAGSGNSIETHFTIGNGDPTQSGNSYNALEIKKNNDLYVSGVGGFNGRNGGYNGIKSLQTVLNGKQDQLTAGTGITISAQNVISATGGGGGGTTYGAGDGINIDSNDDINVKVESGGALDFNASDELVVDYATLAGAIAGSGLQVDSNTGETLEVDYSQIPGNIVGAGLLDNGNGQLEVDEATLAADLANNFLPLTGGVLQEDPNNNVQTSLDVYSPDNNAWAYVYSYSTDTSDPNNPAPASSEVGIVGELPTVADKTYDTYYRSNGTVLIGYTTDNYGTTDSAEFAFPQKPSGQTYTLATLDDISGGGSYTAGNGIDITSGTISVDETYLDSVYLPIIGGTLENTANHTDLKIAAPHNESTAYTDIKVDGTTGTPYIELFSETSIGTDAESFKINGLGNFELGYVNGTSDIIELPHKAGTIALLSDISGGGASYTAGDGINISAQDVISSTTLTNGTGSGSIMTLNGNSASGLNAIALGNYTQATGNNAVAIGNFAAASAIGGIAIGDSAKAKAQYSISLGKNAGPVSLTTGTHGVNLGYYSEAKNPYEIAIGPSNNSINTGTTAEKTQFTVGNGTSYNSRSNLIEAKQNNDIYVVGIGGFDGTNAGTSGVETLQQVIANAGGGGSSLWTSGTGTDSLVAPGTVSAGLTGDAAGTGAVSCGYDSNANGDYSFASGGASTASGDYSFVANNGVADGDYAAAFGTSGANGDYSFAAGYGSSADAAYSIALAGGNVVYDDTDPNDVIDAQYGVAIGIGATVQGQYGVAIGQNAASEHDDAVAIGAGAQASGQNAFAVMGGTANSDNAFAIGGSANADYSVAFPGSQTDAQYSFAAGEDSLAQAYDSVALGGGVVVYDDSDPNNIINAEYGVAIGMGSTAETEYSLAMMGGTASAQNGGSHSVAIGDGATAEGYYDVALTGSSSRGNYSFAASTGIAEGHYSTGLSGGEGNGEGSIASGFGSVAFGYASAALGLNLMTYDQADGTDPTDSNAGEAAFGRYNYSEQDIIFSIGCGHYEPPVDPTDPSDVGTDVRENAITITNDGKIYLKGLGGYTGTSVSGCTDLVSFLNNL